MAIQRCSMPMQWWSWDSAEPGGSPRVHMVQFWSKIYMDLQSEESGMGPIPLDNLCDSNSIIQDTTSNLLLLVLGIS